MKYTRTSIAIPKDLKAQMDSVEPGVSWSRIACKAFEQEVSRIKSESSEHRTIIERIRATKPSESATPSYGQYAKEWIRDHATYEQLELVAEKGEFNANIIEAAFAGFPLTTNSKYGQEFIAEVRRFWSSAKPLI